MKDNPYSKMLDIMSTRGGKSNPPSVEIATVIQLYPQLKMKFRELELTNENLFVLAHLTQAHSHTCPDGGTSVWSENTLKVGDRVALLPTIDRQLFVVLGKEG